MIHTECTLCTCTNCMARYEAEAYDMDAMHEIVLKQRRQAHSLVTGWDILEQDRERRLAAKDKKFVDPSDEHHRIPIEWMFGIAALALATFLIFG